MSKKTLEDQRASPPGLDSTLLMDWLAQQTTQVKKKKKKARHHDHTWDIKSHWNIIRLIPLGDGLLIGPFQTETTCGKSVTLR